MARWDPGTAVAPPFRELAKPERRTVSFASAARFGGAQELFGARRVRPAAQGAAWSRVTAAQSIAAPGAALAPPFIMRWPAVVACSLFIQCCLLPAARAGDWRGGRCARALAPSRRLAVDSSSCKRPKGSGPGRSSDAAHEHALHSPSVRHPCSPLLAFPCRRSDNAPRPAALCRSDTLSSGQHATDADTWDPSEASGPRLR